MSASLWTQLRECFDTDDGSLPGILVTKVTPEGVAAIYSMLRQRSHLVTESAEFWSESEQASVPVDSVPNAAALVVTGQAAPFHHCIGGVMAGGVVLPVLGVFVFADTIELDYRMGPEWGPEEIAGFFELLRECCAVAPGAVVVPASSEGPPYPERFARAWTSYLSNS